MSESAEAIQAQYRRWLADALPDAPDGADLLLGGRDDVVTVDGQTFTPGQLAEVLAAQVLVGVDLPRFAFAGASHSVFLPVFAWRMTVHRQVRAVLALRDADLLVELMVNARMALEHAVLLRAVLKAESAGQGQAFIDSVTAANQETSRLLLASLSRLDVANGSQFSELLAAVERSPLNERPPKASDRVWNGRVSELFRQVDGGERFYPIYRALSDVSHAGVGSAQPYMQRLLSEGHISRHPVPPPMADILIALVWAVWSADDVLQNFLAEGDVRSGQAEALARFGLAPPAV